MNVITKAISSTQYYLALAYFIVACQAQAEARKFAEKLTKVLGNDYFVDDVYNPEMTGTKEEFDIILKKRGIEIDWLGKDKNRNKDKEKADD